MADENKDAHDTKETITKLTTKSRIHLINVALLLIVAVLTLYNQYTLAGISSSAITGAAVTGASNSNLLSALPTGIPEVYGDELGVSFDSVVPSMNILAKMDGSYNVPNLDAEGLERYVRIGSQTACEYCCGARTLVFSNAKPACGCAHSAAMRALIAYLIKYHPEMSDSEILLEANKWKAVFFPKQTLQKIAAAGGSADLSSLPSMVGGC